MSFMRAAGILLHPTSLPGRSGVGDFGPEAFRFVDFLADAGMKLWQVLPLGPTGYGDSPYQCFSTFAGNPLLVGLEELVRKGYLPADEIARMPDFPTERVDFDRVAPWKLGLLHRAAEGFHRNASKDERDAFAAFCAAHASWIDEFALFMALKEEHGLRAWVEWPRELATRDPAAMAEARRRLATRIEAHRFIQFELFSQWSALKRHAGNRNVRIIGDLPIYVAHDSADVWSRRELFRLGDDGRPAWVAGVPPDYFSATGQLWGNPIYRWDAMATDGYRWWEERFRAILAMVDMVRLDHFRGFEAYWEVPAGETTAIHGRWVKGPGAALFRAVTEAIGPLPVIAENLGVITPEVEALRNEFGWPGMRILQFAFGNDPQGPSFRPHNYPRHAVAFSGTHDNDTTVGWWTGAGLADSTRSAVDVEKERDLARRYLATDGREIHWTFIRALFASVADLAIVPLQDVLGLGSEARMNLPARASGNWRWRLVPGALTVTMRDRLRELALLYDR